MVVRCRHGKARCGNMSSPEDPLWIMVIRVGGGGGLVVPDNVISVTEALDTQLMGHGVKLVVGERHQERHAFQHPNSHVPVQKISEWAQQVDEVLTHLAADRNKQTNKQTNNQGQNTSRGDKTEKKRKEKKRKETKRNETKRNETKRHERKPSQHQVRSGRLHPQLRPQAM